MDWIAFVALLVAAAALWDRGRAASQEAGRAMKLAKTLAYQLKDGQVAALEAAAAATPEPENPLVKLVTLFLAKNGGGANIGRIMELARKGKDGTATPEETAEARGLIESLTSRS